MTLQHGFQEGLRETEVPFVEQRETAIFVLPVHGRDIATLALLGAPNALRPQ
ncbi:MAG: hypothetical protein U1E67_12860 [Hyphomicrobiales bacterium]